MAEHAEPLPTVPVGGQKDAPKAGDDLKDGRKTIKFQAKLKDGVRLHEDEEVLRSEARILQRLNGGDQGHAGFQRIIELVSWEESSPVTLTMECIEPFGFDMMSLVMKYHKAQVPGGAVSKRCCRQLYDALGYLQLSRIVHGDLKCDNVLIMRSADIKLIDFGVSCTEGQSPPDNWPQNSYIAPEARGRRTPATYAQDMYGIFAIFNEWQEWTPEFPQDMKDALKKLGKGNPNDRMTLQQLGALGWMKDWRLSREDTKLHLPAVKSTLPLKSGFAMQVTNQVLRMGDEANAKAADTRANGAGKDAKTDEGGCLAGILCLLPSKTDEGGCIRWLCAPKVEEKVHVPEAPLAPVTIGKAALRAAAGIQVLYIDRRFRTPELAPDKPKIIRVPNFHTEIAFGDWMYVGFPEENEAEGEGASVYFKNLSSQAVKAGTQIPESIPKWFEFDDLEIPGYAIGKCIGPKPESLREGIPLRAALASLNLQPEGYLNLRADQGINLAGVKRGDQTIFFPPPTLVFQSGDLGLLVRAENVNGDTESTHSPDVLEDFKGRIPRASTAHSVLPTPAGGGQAGKCFDTC